ncbi:hypothetical protein [Nesterenkonia populi]
MSSPVEEFIAEHVAGREPARYPSRSSEAPRALLSRAGRRRNIHAKRMHHNQHVLMRGARVIGGFDVTLTTLVSAEALEASKDRALAKSYLEAEEIATAPWTVVEASDTAAGLRFLRERGHLFVRPITSGGGAGITRRVGAEPELQKALGKVVDVSSDPAGLRICAMLEQQIHGVDLRAYVVHEQVVSVMARLPFFVVGDGKLSVEELAQRAVTARQENPLLGRYGFDLSHVLEANVPFSSVPANAEVVLLSDEVNIRSGGLTVDVTALVGNELLHTAIEACWALPGARAGAVDLRVDNVENPEAILVTDVNAEASFTPHHYPWMGRGRPVADAIMQTISRR